MLLLGFAVIERRSSHALLPGRILANRNRLGAYLMMLFLATAMFGFFFFLAIFAQEVLGYSALRSGLAFLPFAVTIVVMSGVVSQLVGRIGARPLMLAGTAVATSGMFWFSHISVHSSYVGGLLGPMLVTSAGFGMLFVPMSLVALNRVRAEDSGVASSLLNTGQQVGGAIGLASLGTVTWTAVSGNIKHQLAHVAGGPVPAEVLHRALAFGIALLAFVVVLAMIRVRRADLAGAVSPREHVKLGAVAAEVAAEVASAVAGELAGQPAGELAWVGTGAGDG